MKIFELKGRLANILGLPESPRLWEIGIAIVRKPSPPPKIANIFMKGFTLQCIWEAFEELLEEQGRDLREEAEKGDIKLLLKATNKFFSPLISRRHISRAHPNLQKEILREKKEFLEAIELLSQRI